LIWRSRQAHSRTSFAPALAAGNTVVLKPAETTPLTTVRFAELAADVLLKGVLANLQ